MAEAFFVLGSAGELAQAELRSVLGSAASVRGCGDVATAEAFDQERMTLAALQERLGGTVKTGWIVAHVEEVAGVAAALEGLVVALRPGVARLPFGISVYGGEHRGRAAALKAGYEKLGMTVKRALKSRDVAAKFTTAASVPVLSSVVVTRQKLVGDGIEFCLIPRKDGVAIGVTETVQDYEEWSARDYGRPARDALRGMLPPKVARMMVNIAGGDAVRDTLLDPYCGVGTVLTEAMAVGHRRLIGSDVDQAAIEATRQNVAFEAARRGVAVEPQLLCARAEALATFLPPRSVERVVSEMDLGEPRKGHESRAQLERRLAPLSLMYAQGLNALAHIVTKDAVLIMAFPVYKTPQGDVSANIASLVAQTGFILADGPWRYGRTGQWVHRDIYCFERRG